MSPDLAAEAPLPGQRSAPPPGYRATTGSAAPALTRYSRPTPTNVTVATAATTRDQVHGRHRADRPRSRPPMPHRPPVTATHTSTTSGRSSGRPRARCPVAYPVDVWSNPLPTLRRGSSQPSSAPPCAGTMSPEPSSGRWCGATSGMGLRAQGQARPGSRSRSAGNRWSPRLASGGFVVARRVSGRLSPVPAATDLFDGPVSVMLAKAQDSIPRPGRGVALAFEPKWDGFRGACRCTRTGRLGSGRGTAPTFRPSSRIWSRPPDSRSRRGGLGRGDRRSVDGRLSFDHLQHRMVSAPSAAARLARPTPRPLSPSTLSPSTATMCGDCRGETDACCSTSWPTAYPAAAGFTVDRGLRHRQRMVHHAHRHGRRGLGVKGDVTIRAGRAGLGQGEAAEPTDG